MQEEIAVLQEERLGVINSDSASLHLSEENITGFKLLSNLSQMKIMMDACVGLLVVSWIFA